MTRPAGSAETALAAGFSHGVEAAPAHRSGAAPQDGAGGEGWQVRPAADRDVEQVATAVAELLVELGGTPAGAHAMQAATRELIDDREAGALLVAEADGGEIVGMLAASWQLAIHVPGRYALIQDLWVDPAWRSRAIGRDLLAALDNVAQRHRIARIEVGLPKEGFAQLPATEAFYRANGFSPLGPRMRRVLP